MAPPTSIVPVSLAVVVGVGIFRSEIRDMVTGIKTWITSQWNSYLVIDVKQNPKSAYAIRKKLETLKNKNKKVVSDGITQPQYKVPTGSYSVKIGFLQKIKINYQEDMIILEAPWWIGLSRLQTFMDKIYKTYSSPAEKTVFFTSDENRWSFPIFKNPRNKDKIVLTPEIQDVFQELDQFRSPETETTFRENQQPYRKGLLLVGKAGTGKTTILEVMATEYKMSVHLVNLNSAHMTDTLLINLLTKVPPKSIIVFDEIDKQLETLKANVNNQVSIGGILSAIDGPQRLANGVIVMMTSNSENFLDEHKIRDSLIRYGRIDKIHRLNTIPDLNIVKKGKND